MHLEKNLLVKKLPSDTDRIMATINSVRLKSISLLRKKIMVNSNKGWNPSKMAPDQKKIKIIIDIGISIVEKLVQGNYTINNSEQQPIATKS